MRMLGQHSPDNTTEAAILKETSSVRKALAVNCGGSSHKKIRGPRRRKSPRRVQKRQTLGLP
jgi:hypothetical protein